MKSLIISKINNEIIKNCGFCDECFTEDNPPLLMQCCGLTICLNCFKLNKCVCEYKYHDDIRFINKNHWKILKKCQKIPSKKNKNYEKLIEKICQLCQCIECKQVNNNMHFFKCCGENICENCINLYSFLEYFQCKYCEKYNFKNTFFNEKNEKIVNIKIKEIITILENNDILIKNKETQKNINESTGITGKDDSNRKKNYEKKEYLSTNPIEKDDIFSSKNNEINTLIIKKTDNNFDPETYFESQKILNLQENDSSNIIGKEIVDSIYIKNSLINNKVDISDKFKPKTYFESQKSLNLQENNLSNINEKEIIDSIYPEKLYKIQKSLKINENNYYNFIQFNEKLLKNESKSSKLNENENNNNSLDIEKFSIKNEKNDLNSFNPKTFFESQKSFNSSENYSNISDLNIKNNNSLELEKISIKNEINESKFYENELNNSKLNENENNNNSLDIQKSSIKNEKNDSNAFNPKTIFESQKTLKSKESNSNIWDLDKKNNNFLDIEKSSIKNEKNETISIEFNSELQCRNVSNVSDLNKKNSSSYNLEKFSFKNETKSFSIEFNSEIHNKKEKLSKLQVNEKLKSNLDLTKYKKDTIFENENENLNDNYNKKSCENYGKTLFESEKNLFEDASKMKILNYECEYNFSVFKLKKKQIKYKFKIKEILKNNENMHLTNKFFENSKKIYFLVLVFVKKNIDLLIKEFNEQYKKKFDEDIPKNSFILKHLKIKKGIFEQIITEINKELEFSLGKYKFLTDKD